MRPLSLLKARSGRTALELATAAVKEAGQLLLDNFYAEKEVHIKGRGNVVTNVDHLVENHVIDLLRREYPTWGVLSEEQPAIIPGADTFTWVLDPLDGTRNYASGIPFFSVALALVQSGQELLGLTYDPMRDELFCAERGNGAFMNHRPIKVSNKRTVPDCILGLDMGYQNEVAGLALKMLGILWPGMQSIRIMGSAALGLSYAAAGRIDLYFHQGMSPWDIAGGILQVREAGGIVTDRHGAAGTYLKGEVIASNREVHADFMARTQGMEWRLG